MLLIPCPWCGRAAGERVSATAARRISPVPLDPAAVDDAAWADFPLLRATIRRALTPSAGGTCMAAAGSSTACATRSPTGSSPPTGPANGGRHDPAVPHRRRVAASTATKSSDFSFDGRRLRGLSPATRWPPRCWRTACIWSGGRSNITGRAASCPPGPRNPTRWSRSIAARAASRPTCARHRSNFTTACVARSQNRFPSLRFDLGAVAGLAVAAAVRRVLLQDLHVAARPSGGTLYEPAIRARRRSGACAGAARPGSLPASLRALRRAGDRRRSRRPRGRARAPRRTGARVILCDEQAEPGGSLLARDRRRASTAWLRSEWLQQALARCAGVRGDAAAPHHRVRLVPRQPDRPGGAGDRSSGRSRTRTCHASGCGRCGRAGS